MLEKKNGLRVSLPVFMSYIVMGFVDLVGVITNYVKSDFGLPDNEAQLIPMFIFVWFFLLSVPIGIWQDKIGKKNMMNIGMGITAIGMIIPFINYSFPVILGAVVFLGIGNTIVQVAANPLLQDATPKDKFSSYMSLAQFTKAICSLLGPIITAAIAIYFGDWKLVFLVYFATSVIAILWLYFTKIEERKPIDKPATFTSCLSLLKNKFILIMVFAIFMVVGIDVGLNTNIPNYLSSIFDLSLEQASLGISIYFTAVMIGRFSGAVLLNWISAKKFLFWSIIFSLISIMAMIFAPTLLIARISIFMVGLGAANIFPLIFTISLQKMPERSNEISGLMVMAISGGAILPPIMGVASENWGVVASLYVIVIAFVYILGSSIYTLKK